MNGTRRGWTAVLVVGLLVATAVSVVLGIPRRLTELISAADARLGAVPVDDIALAVLLLSPVVVVAARRSIHRYGSDVATAAASARPDAIELALRARDSIEHEALQRRRTMRERIERTIRQGDFRMVFQPVFDIRGDRVVGYEALARFPTDLYASPDRWFAAAEEVGLGVQLELAALDRALSMAIDLPYGAYVSVNLSPTALLAPALSDVMARYSVDRVVVELTEHLAVADYLDYVAVMTALRAAGVRFAVDDTGAGYSSLRHVLNLAPDIVKLDRELIANLDQDPARRALVSALLTFCDDIGVELIAEGVETEPDLVALRHLGVRFAQGYLLAEPCPVPEPHRV